MCASLISCPLCSQPHFNSLEALRIGLIKVATENLTCPICSDVFIGLDKLTIHLFSHCETIAVSHRDEEPVKLKSVKIQKVTNKPSEKEPNAPHKKLTKYQKTHSASIHSSTQSEPFSVPVFNINTLPFIGIPKNISESICNGTSVCNNNNNNIDKSVLENNQIKVLSEKCDICGFYFLGKNILQMHKKLIHNFQDSQTCTKHPCHLCSKVFKMRGSLMVHLRVVHLGISPTSQLPPVEEKLYQKESNKSPQIETKTIEDKSTKRTECKPFHIETSETPTANNVGVKQWECDICHKLFTTKYFLKKHKRLHTGEMPYSCVQCNKTFTFQQSYHKHLLYHNDDKPHTCTHCGRSFKELSTLHNHQRIHTGEKPFSCESCGKCFRQRVSYLVHRRIHTGVMPYKCTACDKSFRYKVSQRTHKCSIQPPGTVVRQSGELVQKLIKNQPIVENLNNTDDKCVKSEYKHFVSDNINQHMTESILESSIFNKKCDEEGKNIIDEIIKDSIKTIDFGEPTSITESMLLRSTNPNDVYSIISTNQVSDQNIPSPSEKFKGLTLTTSPEHQERNYQIIPNNNFRYDFASTSATINENVFGKIYK